MEARLLMGRELPVKAGGSDLSWPMAPRLRKGQELSASEWPSPPPVFRYEEAKVFEDLPWPDTDTYIVSGRFRTFLQQEAPGVAQYLPVKLEGPGSARIKDSCWAMNWLQTFDCLDEEASMCEDEKGKYVMIPMVDPSRIPPDGVLGLLGGYTIYKIIRNDLKLKIQKAGFLGPQFYRIAHSDGTDFTPFIKRDGSGAVKAQFPTKLPPKRRKPE